MSQSFALLDRLLIRRRQIKGAMMGDNTSRRMFSPVGES
jgi:hypothetical protein